MVCILFVETHNLKCGVMGKNPGALHMFSS